MLSPSESLTCAKWTLTVPPQPSPSAEHSGFLWRRTPTSTTTSSHRSMLSDGNDGFSISRESFDSYRRSFVRGPRALYLIVIRQPSVGPVLAFLFLRSRESAHGGGD